MTRMNQAPDTKNPDRMETNPRRAPESVMLRSHTTEEPEYVGNA